MFDNTRGLNIRFSAFLAILFYSFPVYAYHLPLWEVGVGVGYLNATHYRGAKTTRNITLPIPFAVYRGERLKADRSGLRGKLFDSKKINITLSGSFNLSVNSDDTNTRNGMPNLDAVIEVGPSLNANLWQTQDSNHILWLKFPLRAAFSVGDPLMKYQGFNFAPFIQIFNRYPSRSTEWRLKMSLGPIFGDTRYHSYYYDVDSQYATPEREEYHASSGYNGSRVTFSFARNSKHLFLGIFARYDNLSSAVFTDSPLVETENSLIYGLAIAWVFGRSETDAKHTDDD